MQVKLLLVTFHLNGRLRAVSTQNRLNGCQIFGWFGFHKPNPNRISFFRTSLFTVSPAVLCVDISNTAKSSEQFITK